MDDQANFSPEGIGALAEHLSPAAITDKARSYFEAVGDIESTAQNHARAIEHYRRAVALEKKNGNPPPMLARKLADQLLLSGCATEATIVLEEIEDLSEPADEPNLRFAYWADAQSAVSLERYVRAAEDYPEKAVHAETLVGIASDYAGAGDIERAESYLERAEPLIGNGSMLLRARFFGALGRVKLGSGKAEEALKDLRECKRLTEAYATGHQYFAILGNYARCMRLVGDSAEALHVWKRLLARAEASRMGWHIQHAELNCGICLVDAGEFGQAARFVERAMQHDLACAAVRIDAAIAGIPLGLALERDDILSWCADEEVISLALRSREPARIGPVCAVFAQLFIARYRMEDARALFKSAISLLGSADDAHVMLALAAAHAENDVSLNAVHMLEESAKRRCDPLGKAFAQLAQARLAHGERDRALSKAKADSAAAAFAVLEMPYWRAQALELQGREHHALELYESIGDLANTRRLKNQRGHCNQGTVALTRRQGQIAALVARGCSNKEIAASLQISENTVEKHLQGIYGRFGLSSRSKLVAQLINTDRGRRSQPA